MFNFSSSLAMFRVFKISLEETPYEGTTSSKLNTSPPFLKNSEPPAFITFNPIHFVDSKV